MFLNFTSAFFWYKLQAMAEILIIEYLATYTLRKKSKFVLRMILTSFLCLLIAFFFPVFSYSSGYLSAIFLIFIGITFLSLSFCYDEPPINIFSCCILANTIQHLSYLTSSFFQNMININAINPYEENTIFSFDIVNFMIYLITYLLIYWISWAFLFHRIRNSKNLSINRTFLIWASSLILLVNVVLNLIAVNQSYDKITQFILYCYSALFCIVSVALFLLAMDNSYLKNEVDTMNMLLEKDKENYKQAKENIDLINIKCHDLKHQIVALSSEGIDKDELKKITEAINIYDTPFKTNCEALNICLAEKNAICAEKGIEFYCLMNDIDLNFISKGDIYSLFGNALSNAIEAVENLKEPEKKIIHLRVVEKGTFISIHVDNYFNPEHQIEIDEQGMPKTTKADNNYHGFGMKSMNLIVSRLQGGLSVSIDLDIFNLDILLPRPPSCKK